MIAYHGDPKIKSDIIDQLEWHRRADQLVKGQYWAYGKGCAVACTIHSGNHIEYEDRFGIPVSIAWLEDTIFEYLPNKEAMEWPVRLMSAINVGADLSLVSTKFILYVLLGLKVTEKNEQIIANTVEKYTQWIASGVNTYTYDFNTEPQIEVCNYALYPSGTSLWAYIASQSTIKASDCSLLQGDAYWIAASDILIQLIEAEEPETAASLPEKDIIYTPKENLIWESIES